MIEYKKKILANGLTVVVNRDPALEARRGKHPL